MRHFLSYVWFIIELLKGEHMKKQTLAYIHNNHTTAILGGIKLPAGVKIKKIKNLKHYLGTDSNIIMFGLTGNNEIRSQEDKLIKNALELNKKIHPTFLIISPFSFEPNVDLSFVQQKIEVLKKAKVDFSVLELMELVRKYPNFTFTQAFKVVQKKVELICKIKFETLDNHA